MTSVFVLLRRQMDETGALITPVFTGRHNEPITVLFTPGPGLRILFHRALPGATTNERPHLRQTPFAVPLLHWC